MKIAFFDLDDTLFDHLYSRRCAFQVIRHMHPGLSSIVIHERESFYEQLIWAN